MKVGEEACIYLGEFSLEGSATLRIAPGAEARRTRRTRDFEILS